MIRVLVVIGILVVAGFAWSTWRREKFRRSVSLAEAEFARERLKLQEDFRAAANVSGKPRGLRWKSVEFQDRILLARDRANGELVGLAGATIAFEAVVGGDMEEVEAVGNLRAGTAILSWSGHDWTTAGKVAFNLEPQEVLERYREGLVPVTA